MIGYNIMVLVEILTRCSYETLTAKFVQVVKICLFTVVLNSFAKIAFLPKRPLLTYVYYPCHTSAAAAGYFNFFHTPQSESPNSIRQNRLRGPPGHSSLVERN